MNFTCWCSRRVAWRADRSRGSWRRAGAIRTNGPQKKTACSSTTTTAASPLRRWNPSKAVTLPGRRIWRPRSSAFDLRWAAAGRAARNLGLAPIHERGTPEQREKYVSGAAPLKPGETRKQVRAAFALTEPIPFIGVETGMLAGKVRVADWKDGGEPLLQVEKRGRFITNMGFANVVTAAVDSDYARIKGSCMVILEEGDPGIWDRGTPTKKLIHQLSSTNDPVFNLKVPASRIVGGYTVKDGVIIPNFSHSEVIEAVFRRTRVTVGLMTAAKLLSAVEPVILYQRRRFRDGEGAPGTPRYELGIQQKEDALHRLVDVWATGEASASLGFMAARLFDELDPLEREKDQWLADKKLTGRAALKEMAKKKAKALELVKINSLPVGECDLQRADELESDLLVKYAILDSLANVFCPACKLWNTGHGANIDARDCQPHGRLRRHGRLPRIPWSEMDGCAARSNLRGAGGRAAFAAFHHDNERVVPRAVQTLDHRDAPACGRTSRHRRLHAGERDAVLALDAQPRPDRRGCRWHQAVSQNAPGRDVPTHRCAVLAAGRAAIYFGCCGTGTKGRGKSRAGRRSVRHGGFFQRSCPCSMRPRRRRNQPHHLGTGFWL